MIWICNCNTNSKIGHTPGLLTMCNCKHVLQVTKITKLFVNLISLNLIYNIIFSFCSHPSSTTYTKWNYNYNYNVGW